MTRYQVLVVCVAVVMAITGLAACGAPGGAGAAASDPGGSDAAPAAGMCPQEEPDCIDTPQLADDEPVEIDETGIEQLRRDAQYHLGKRQSELSEKVRVGRVDDEHLALTEDYQVGRITVELDDLEGDGDPVVTSATVELPDGPETFELQR